MRNGYDPLFLGDNHPIELPEASLALAGDILQPPGQTDGEVVVPYINYSLVMSRSTKQALYSAANVDLEKMQPVPSKKGRKWFYDPRVGKENQVTNYVYKNTLWDRGHLTRRTAVTWGPDVNHATQASNDSCAYTNASMQHKYFNEDDWRTIEKQVSDFEHAKRLTVITGPIFTQADRYFTREMHDEPVRIPAGFWKTLSYIDASHKLQTQAFLFFQDIESIRSDDDENAMVGRLEDMQITTTELSHWTGLEFDKAMFDSNPLKFYSGPESISIKKRKEIARKNPDTLVLDAGIVDDTSIGSAREQLPLDEFYDLISEVSWI